MKTKITVFIFFCVFCLSTLSHAALLQKSNPAARIDFQDIVLKAKDLSKKDFQEPGQNLPDSLKKMNYDQWRDIRFKPARSIWKGEPFSLQFFHLGFLYQTPVIVHVVDSSGDHEIPFSPNLFTYGPKSIKDNYKDIGFAGFRVHYPLNTPTYADELVVFLGATYFRALGKGQSYGISARGLAINTAQDSGEEFPYYREYWIVHPSSRSKKIKIYALLDSQSITGAYEFIVQPGEETTIKVNSVLFVRQPILKMGIAPLNSMFLYGENSGFKGEDFRPEVHDSDGFLVHNRSGEWTWHPLIDPSKLSINSFSGEKPFGFGLLQRDTDFDHYQDLEARYDLRPSVWVTPKGDWGKGHLELVQIPTDTEFNDNVVAYWMPERTFEKGDTLRYTYTLTWFTASHRYWPKGFVQSTRIVKKPDEVMFIIDFIGEALKKSLKLNTPTPDVWVGQGAKLIDMQSYKNDATGGWRLVLHVKLDPQSSPVLGMPAPKPAIEMRASLKSKDSAMSETWSYTYLP